MPQIGSLKFLSFSASVAVNPFKLSLPSSSATLISKHRSLITAASSSYRKGHSRGGGKGVFPQRRGFTMGKEKRKDEDMADNNSESMRFNRKRAEGRDGGMKKNLQLKVRKLNPSNTICYFQILGTGMDTQDTSPSVLLFFDKQRIVFNAGEGLQRFCTEHKIKISKIDHMFLTRVCSETAGGLPGLLLTLAGIGEDGMSVNLWGPSGLKYLDDAMGVFIPNAAMAHSHSFGESSQGDSPTFKNSVSTLTSPIVLIDDEVVKISAILLQPIYPDQSTPGTAGSFDSHIANSDSLYSKGQAISFPGSGSSTRNASLRSCDISVVYACELPEIKGKFDPSKAAALDLKPGPKYRELQLGKSVKSDTQSNLVHPTDVLGPSIPGPVVLLVDCPTPAHLICLHSLQSLNCYYTDVNTLEGSKSVNCVIHLSPASVTKTADYGNWMRRFGSAQHIMAGHEMKNIAVPILRSSARIMTRLNYVCPRLFPSSGFWDIDQVKNSHMGCKSSSEDSSSLDCISAENLLKFHLRPYAQLGLDRSLIACLQTPSEIVRELLSEIPEIQNASEDVCKLWRASGEVKSISSPSDGSGGIMEEPWLRESTCIRGTKHHLEVPSCLDNISRKDMEIVLLGTGSSQPSKYRNVSSIYINLFSKGSVLFDCGEGTLGQLKRRFGVEGADNAVKALRLIWISHIHADHHTGLARVLSLRCKLLHDLPHDPLLVVGPKQLKKFLDAYSRLEDLDMQFLDCRHTTEDSWNAIADSLQSYQDRCLEKADAKDTDSYGPGGGRQSTTNSIFVNYSQMQSYRKHPGSPVDIAVALPMLTRLKKVLHDAGLEVLYSVPVVHCPQAFGVVLKASKRKNVVGKVIPGWKLVYSGDTRPCQALEEASHDATVLIHEATFEDGMEDEALAKNHSTTMEAVKIGASADAYRIILTHFSQRYPKIPVFDETAMSKTCIAFDLMSVNLCDSRDAFPKNIEAFFLSRWGQGGWTKGQRPGQWRRRPRHERPRQRPERPRQGPERPRQRPERPRQRPEHRDRDRGNGPLTRRRTLASGGRP